MKASDVAVIDCQFADAQHWPLLVLGQWVSQPGGQWVWQEGSLAKAVKASASSEKKPRLVF